MKVEKSKQQNIVQSIQDELGEDTKVNVFIGKRIPRQASYTMLYQSINLELVKILKPNACKVLLYLMSKTGYDNYIGVDQETIMDELEYKTKASVVNAIQELKKQNIIISVKDVQDRRRNVYILNPYQSWKGKVANRIKAVTELQKGDTGIQLNLPFLDKPNLL